MLQLRFDPPAPRRPLFSRPLALRAAHSIGTASRVAVATVEVIRHLLRPRPTAAD